MSSAIITHLGHSHLVVGVTTELVCQIIYMTWSEVALFDCQ